jgi:uncharacterized membrane protein
MSLRQGERSEGSPQSRNHRWLALEHIPVDWIRFAVFGSSIPAGMTVITNTRRLFVVNLSF